MIPIHLHAKPDADAAAAAAGEKDRFQCPVTGLECDAPGF
jgi:hypothetical protein